MFMTLYVYVYIHIYIYMHKERERERDVSSTPALGGSPPQHIMISYTAT